MEGGIAMSSVSPNYKTQLALAESERQLSDAAIKRYVDVEEALKELKS